jgi:hypothetical protein
MSYELLVQLGQEKEESDWCFVCIRRSDTWPLKAELLVKDAEITVDHDFLMTAESA